jgi:hypothetical protein
MKQSVFILVVLLVSSIYSQTDCPQPGQCQQPNCPSNYSFNGTVCVRLMTMSWGNWGGNN